MDEAIIKQLAALLQENNAALIEQMHEEIHDMQTGILVHMRTDFREEGEATCTERKAYIENTVRKRSLLRQTNKQQ